MGLAHGTRSQRKKLPSVSVFQAQGRREQLAMRTQGGLGGFSCGSGQKALYSCMARAMMSIKRIQGWGCSDCAWVFVPSGPPLGNTIEEMMRNFEAKRHKEFTSHLCIKLSGTQAQEDGLPKKTK